MIHGSKQCPKCQSKETIFIRSNGGEGMNPNGEVNTEDWFLYQCKNCSHYFWITKEAHSEQV